MARILLALGLAGCGAALDYEAPPGFARAESDWRSAHFKASDNVGLKLLLFDNVEGGTLEYWGQDLVRKLEARGYALQGQAPLTAANHVAGTRFDFVLDTGDSELPPKFLVVSLFVTDGYRYVAQIAGDKSLLPRYASRVPRILAELKPRGCKPRSEVCRGPQPPNLARAN
jgi:hypothetical protein